MVLNRKNVLIIHTRIWNCTWIGVCRKGAWEQQAPYTKSLFEIMKRESRTEHVKKFL